MATSLFSLIVSPTIAAVPTSKTSTAAGLLPSADQTRPRALPLAPISSFFPGHLPRQADHQLLHLPPLHTSGASPGQSCPEPPPISPAAGPLSPSTCNLSPNPQPPRENPTILLPPSLLRQPQHPSDQAPHPLPCLCRQQLATKAAAITTSAAPSPSCAAACRPSSSSFLLYPSPSIAAPTEHPNRSRGRLHLPPAPHTRPPTSTPPQQAVFTAAPDPSTTPKPDHNSGRNPLQPINHQTAPKHLQPADPPPSGRTPSLQQPSSTVNNFDPKHNIVTSTATSWNLDFIGDFCVERKVLVSVGFEIFRGAGIKAETLSETLAC